MGWVKVINLPARSRVPVAIKYTIDKPLRTVYTEYHGSLTVWPKEAKDPKTSPSTQLWFGVWTTPIRIELGGLYLRPEQKQLVRLNLGLATPTVEGLAEVRLEVIDRRHRKEPAHADPRRAAGEDPGAARQDPPGAATTSTTCCWPTWT